MSNKKDIKIKHLYFDLEIQEIILTPTNLSFPIFCLRGKVMDDTSLVHKAKEGDVRAFDELVKRHYQGLYQVAWRYVGDHGGSDEVVQETFIKAFRSLPQFRGESSFKSWVYRIAINTAKNLLRSRGQRDTVDHDDVVLAFSERNFSNLEDGQTTELLKKAVDALPPRQKQVLELRVYDDLSFKEIADALECPFDTAKANYRHAIQNLKKLLESSRSDDLKELLLAWEDPTHETQ